MVTGISCFQARFCPTKQIFFNHLGQKADYSESEQFRPCGASGDLYKQKKGLCCLICSIPLKIYF